MAVYTQVPAEALADFLTRFEVGEMVAYKGIAEGVENSNYLVDTATSRYILTLYEKRVAAADLGYFLNLMDHLAARGVPAPPAIADREGRQIHELMGRPCCLIAFKSGVSPSRPTAAQAHAAGAALGAMHVAAADFAQTRANDLGPAGWAALLARDPARIETLVPGIGAAVAAVTTQWPASLPRGTIHADLFPDNVLMLGDRVSGLIDFYFACTDLLAYDLAVMHSAWAFDSSGAPLDRAVGAALIEGYEHERPLSGDERAALPLLARGACLRFALTRAWDWLNTPADALVTRKDPLAYWRRYQAYRSGDMAIQ